jgi:flavorubredoxin
MVAAVRPQSRLTLQTLEIAPETTAIRSLDWDRDRFDIEFELQNGTTYNSFLIRGEKVALVDTSHEKFRQLYLDAVQGLIDPTAIDYLIVSHTEPDHSGLIQDMLLLAPQMTVVGSKVAIQFLEGFVHLPFKRQLVKSGDRLDLGLGHELEFVSAPNLHWPDTILTTTTKPGFSLPAMCSACTTATIAPTTRTWNCSTTTTSCITIASWVRTLARCWQR